MTGYEELAPMTNKCEFDQQGIYQIRVRGKLDPKWSDWFNGATIAPQANGETILTSSVVDQAALYSLLGRIRGLGLPLLSICRVGDRSQL
jgi:hypothetical protein